MNFFLTLFLVVNINITVFSQVIYFQDIFHGEVSCVGFSSGDGNGQITLPTNLNEGTIPKKIFLVCYGMKGNNYVPEFRQFSIDGKSFLLDTLIKSTVSAGNNTLISLGSDYNGHITYIVDLTSYVTEVNSTITINWLQDPFFPPNDCPSCYVSSPMLLILNENITMPKISVSLFINDIDNEDNIFLTYENLNEAFFNHPIALGIQTDRLGWGISDGYSFELNQQNLGEISTSDPDEYNLFSGAIGCFHYGNNVFTGLTGDTPDSLFSGNDPIIHNADGLAKINSYLNSNIQSIELTVSYSGNSLNQHNIFISNLFAYSTPCQPQNVSITPDTTICPNAPFQLSASGGIAYEWLPEVGLSCYDCPNPVFSGDSSRLYTVRIWGSDSCSVVRPVMIHVRKQPKTTFYNQTTTLCGEAQALINWQTAGNNSYSLNDGVFQSTGVFNQVAAGNQLLTVRDAFGCRFDTVVAIDSYLVVDAGLLVSPTSGVAPLEIQIANQSTNFTDWSWRVNNAFQSNVNPTFQAVTGGNYEIELIAWQNDSTCADTAVQNVFISETGFYIFGSSIVAASSASQNAFLVYTNGKPMIDISIYDAQGRLLKTNTKIQLTEGANGIWNSSEMEAIASEMVFYKIDWQTASDSGRLEGKTVVMR